MGDWERNQEIIVEGLSYRATAIADAITLISAYASRVDNLRLDGIKRVLRREIKETRDLIRRERRKLKGVDRD